MFFTNDLRDDGFGAQYQSIIWSILFAEIHEGIFLYSDIKRMDNPTNNTQKFIEDAIKTMNIQGNYPSVTSVGKTPIYALKWPYFYGEIENNMERYHSSPSFAKIKSLYFQNKKNPFDVSYTNVAVHVRRPLAQDIRTEGSDTPDSYYLNVINTIYKNRKSSKPIVFHIYSTGSPEMFDAYKEYPVIFHLTDDTFDTFQGMVFADILVLSASSFSYTAGLLSDGIVVYKPFWHPPRKHWVMC